MAADTAALAEKVFSQQERPAHIVAHQSNVRGMTGLAASFHISAREQRPEPMLIVAMGFLDAGGGTSIALMARRAAELVRVMNLQKIGLGMTGERAGILVRLFTFGRHGCGGQLDRLANAQVARLAAIHDV